MSENRQNAIHCLDFQYTLIENFRTKKVQSSFSVSDNFIITGTNPHLKKVIYITFEKNQTIPPPSYYCCILHGSNGHIALPMLLRKKVLTEYP